MRQKKGQRTAVIAAGAMATIAASASAWGQDQRATRDRPAMEDIIVTGVARPVNTLDSSVSVSALSPDQIAQSVPRTTAEIFRFIPGVRSEASGGEGNANIAVRGLPIASGGAKFLQLQEDGMPILQFGDIAFGNADIFLRADQTIATIQTVRGGSSSTLASNAPGGIINIISKDGSTPGGLVQLSKGLDYRDTRIDFDVGAPLTQTLRFNIGGFWRAGEGPRRAGYTANRGYQIKANVTQDIPGGHIRIYLKRLDDHAIGYLPMPTLVTGTNAHPHYRSLPAFDIRNDAPQSAHFRSDAGFDGNNRLRVTDVRDGMHPVVTTLGFEAIADIADGWRIEDRFRWSNVHGNFVSPFPALVAGLQSTGNTIGQYLTDQPGPYSFTYATGPSAGQPVNAATLNGNGLVMFTHLFNTTLNDLGNATNDLRISKQAGNLTLTAGYYRARQKIDLDWTWNSYLLEVKGNNAALLNIIAPSGEVLTRNGLSAYGVPFWGNCCQRSYNARYDLSAFYGSAGFELGQLSLDASLRYDSMKARGSYAGTLQVANFDVDGDGIIQPLERSVSLINNAAPRPIHYRTHYLSWSIGANIRLTPDAAVFARASRGGRSNADRVLFGVVRRDGSIARKNAVNFVDQLELGTKLRSGPVSLFATLFRATTQEQNFEVTSGRFLERVYRATGLELESTYRRGIFDVRTGVTWTRARIASDALTPAFVGHTPRRQPEWIVTAMPSLDFGVVQGGFSLIGSSKAYAQDNNRLIFPAYAQVNAFVNVRPRQNLLISLTGNNLFNAIGITEAEEGLIVNNSSNYVRARAIPGRSVSVSAQWAF
ncbi:TonB-dependent receptor [Sphingobium subterraneum]|uniref:Outer membrane receptor protein involved in Fe transport n=1 Tax=Sphingobium subterraneum TaxID=627688 RepID=A0A841J0Y9_9SPHN|nr:TonB-dependent receptor [Sphingobium subterraneum]MBB6124374.1 outer membrane receptor protein involved in Fe transport [Sphingobium subterraneum]